MKSRKTKIEKARNVVIQFVGRHTRTNPARGKPELVARRAPAQIVNGNKTIDLPSDAIQKKRLHTPGRGIFIK